MKKLGKKLFFLTIWICTVSMTAAAGGLVTGASRGYQPGDKVLWATDFRNCPVGEMPEGFDRFRGTPECVKYNDHIWVSASTPAELELYKKIDLGREDFSIEFTVIIYASGDHFKLNLFKKGPKTKGWDKEVAGRTLDVQMKYCEINVGGIGRVAIRRGCRKKPFHFAIQVRRGQYRLYLNGKRLTAAPWPLKKDENVSGFSFFRNDFDAKPYDVLISDIKVTKYTKQEAKPTPEQLGIRVEKTAEGSKLTVPEKVLFDFNKFTLKPEARKALDAVARYIRTHPAKKIVVTGYTDNIGTDAYNLKLSLQRAQSVADYLMDCGKVPSRLFKIVGRGKADPIADNSTEEGRAKNRRVEIRLIK